MKNKVYSFTAIIEQTKAGMDAAFIKIPFDVKTAFGKTRLKIKAAFDGIEYRGSIAIMDKNIGPVIGLKKDIRQQINKSFGDSIQVTMQEDIEPRIVEVPDDLRKVLSTNHAAKEIFENFAYTHRKEYVNWINEAKKAETRDRRILKAIAMISSGKKYS